MTAKDSVMHNSFSSRWMVAAFAAGCALTLPGQSRVDAQDVRFKSGIAMVPLTVTVTDSTGKYVRGLTADDFRVFEDDVQQSLSFFACDDVPVDVALVVDTSGSMRADLPLVQAAATGLVRKLRPIDRGSVVELKDSAGIPQSFTSDHGQVEAAIRGLSTSGSTALYDGLYVVLKQFERERRTNVGIRRQVLVLLSDGLDNKSHLSFEDVMDSARRVEVSIYVIALKGDAAPLPRSASDGRILHAAYAMGTVARESGGRTFSPKSARELPAIYSAIAEEFVNQYELGYIPTRPGGDGAFRRVTVRVPPQTNALARTRSGYHAARTRAGM
jgi:Ca-activated chloride channel family protein